MDPKVVQFENFPFGEFPTLHEWAETIARELFHPVQQVMDGFLDSIFHNPFLPGSGIPMPYQNGEWCKYVQGQWRLIAPYELPAALIFDLEAVKETPDSPYNPFMAMALGIDGIWYAWAVPPDDARKWVPFPKDRIIIGHNIVEYDRTYLSAEYEYLQPNIQYLDTRVLATWIYGIQADEEDSKESQMLTMYKALRANYIKGKAVPDWFQHACTGSLKELAFRLLGEKIEKTVREDLEYLTAFELYQAVPPTSVLEYCAQDVFTTYRLFKELLSKVRGNRVAPSTASWVGTGMMSQCRIFLDDWRGFCTQTEAQVEQIKESHLELIRKLAYRAIAHPERFPVFDWGKSHRSKWAKENFSEVPYRWRIDLEKNPSFSARIGLELLELRWNGERIHWKSFDRTGAWFAGEMKLPHPKGEDQNLSTPFCAGYRLHFETETLTSDALSQAELLQLYDELTGITQWISYRSRYSEVREYPTSWGDMVVCPIMPSGTVSRRAIGKLWQVLPTEKSKKIGCQVMKHIKAPKGYKVVKADFDAQEIWLATALTDAQVGKIGSNPWCEASLFGSKELETDNHTKTAKRFGISRTIAKFVNFGDQYGAGLEKIALILYSGLQGAKSMDECRQLAQEYREYMNGPQGVARTTKQTLKNYSNRPGLRSLVLGAKIPESLDVQYAGRKNFVTTRTNWPIQSSGVDLLHLTLTLIQAYCIEKDIDAFFLISWHDSIAFAVREGQEDAFKPLFQSAHYLAKSIAMEQARIQALHAMGNLTPEIQPWVIRQAIEFRDQLPETQKWFSTIEISDTFA